MDEEIKDVTELVEKGFNPNTSIMPIPGDISGILADGDRHYTVSFTQIAVGGDVLYALDNLGGVWMYHDRQIDYVTCIDGSKDNILSEAHWEKLTDKRKK